MKKERKKERNTLRSFVRSFFALGEEKNTAKEGRRKKEAKKEKLSVRRSVQMNCECIKLHCILTYSSRRQSVVPHNVCGWIGERFVPTATFTSLVTLVRILFTTYDDLFFQAAAANPPAVSTFNVDGRDRRSIDVTETSDEGSDEKTEGGSCKKIATCVWAKYVHNVAS